MSTMADDPIHLIQQWSHILHERLGQHPEWTSRLRNERFLTQPKPAHILRDECARWCSEASSVAQGLRWCKYYELARLAWRDWGCAASVEELLLEWSTVADTLLDTALNTSLPTDNPFCLVGVGKLGARELNISSDVDLLLCYDDTAAERAANQAPQLLRALHELLEQRTSDGFVFRLDWDLRPEGRSGAAAFSYDGALRYYETRGAAWERMMLLRARPVAGDLALGKRFLASLQPFIFPRHTSVTILEELRRMKDEIAQDEAAREHNLKLGRGGIREVEFVAHALQLLHGGKLADLQTPHTFTALRALRQHRLLPQSRADALLAGYDFLRRVENMVQIDNERHLHLLPSADDQLQALAQRTLHDAKASAADLMTPLEIHRERVHEAFHLLYSVPYEKLEILESVESNLRTCTTPEEQLDGLVWSKRQTAQHILSNDIAGSESFPEICRHLTLLADVMIEEVLQIARAQCQARFGTPREAIYQQPAPFAILAMGSCGALEMDYASDLDLIFLYGGDGETDGAHVISSGEFFAKLGQRIISLLGLRVRYGRLYTVDVDLRPSGRFGVLVTSADAFQRYQRDEADFWEHQALLRARLVTGDTTFMERLKPWLEQVPFATPCPPKANTRIAELRRRSEQEKSHENDTHLDLKFGPGGFDDIKAIVQYLQMRHGANEPALREANTWRALDACAKLGLLPAPDAARLAETYTFLRRLLGHYRLITGAQTTSVAIHGKQFGALVEALQLGTADHVAAHLGESRTWVRAQLHAQLDQKAM